MAGRRDQALANIVRHQWQPGRTPYYEWLAKLTPEEREAHMAKRRAKKAMKEAMRQVIEQYQNQWCAEIHTAAWAVLQRARNTGDPQAFMAVYDRIIGRPADTPADAGRPLPWSDD